jgi:hypothetical protein
MLSPPITKNYLKAAVRARISSPAMSMPHAVGQQPRHPPSQTSVACDRRADPCSPSLTQFGVAFTLARFMCEKVGYSSASSTPEQEIHLVHELPARGPIPITGSGASPHKPASPPVSCSPRT